MWTRIMNNLCITLYLRTTIHGLLTMLMSACDPLSLCANYQSWCFERLKHLHWATEMFASPGEAENFC